MREGNMSYLIRFLGGFTMKPFAFVLGGVLVVFFAFGLLLADRGLPTTDLSAARAEQLRAQTSSQQSKDQQALNQQHALSEEELRYSKISHDEQVRHDEAVNKLNELQHANDMERDSTI